MSALRAVPNRAIDRGYMSLMMALGRWLKLGRLTRRDIKRGFINIEIAHHRGGFFAQLNWCLYIFCFAKYNSIDVNVSLVSENYRVRPGKKDWFTDFFQYNLVWKNTVLSAIYKKKINSFDELGFIIRPDLTLIEANEIFFHYVSLREDIQNQISEFCNRYFTDKYILGVHYRGTDKGSEAPRVSYQEFLEAINRSIRDEPKFRMVFVTSDEADFISFISDSLPDHDVVWRDDSTRSVDGRAVHLSNLSSSGTLIGYDALINSVLLSRCAKIIRTSSFLSAWSAIFNPDVEIETLNIPYDNCLWYPEREILRTTARPTRRGSA
jgi:hypothetical protein